MRRARASLVALSVILLLSVANLVGLWVFSSGFLSARLELPGRSSPSDREQALGCTPESNCNEAEAPHFDRVVILVVDAMRVDFLFPSSGGGTCTDGALDGGLGGSRRRRKHEGQMPRMAAMLDEAVSRCVREEAGIPCAPPSCDRCRTYEVPPPPTLTSCTGVVWYTSSLHACGWVGTVFCLPLIHHCSAFFSPLAAVWCRLQGPSSALALKFTADVPTLTAGPFLRPGPQVHR